MILVGTCRNRDEQRNIKNQHYKVIQCVSFTYLESDPTVPIMALWMLSAYHDNSKAWPAPRGGNPSLRLSLDIAQVIGPSFWFQRASPWKSQSEKWWRWQRAGGPVTKNCCSMVCGDARSQNSWRVAMWYHVIICLLIGGMHLSVLMNSLWMFDMS